MDSDGAILILRFLHIMAGVFWVGGAIFMNFFTMPVARAAGPAGGQFVGQLMTRTHFSNYMLGAGIITVASGLTLYWDFYAGLAWQLADPGPQVIFGLGGLIAIVVAVLANTLLPRTSRRLGQIATAVQFQGAPTATQSAERDRLSKRMRTVGMTSASLLLVATALMAVGRYV